MRTSCWCGVLVCFSRWLQCSNLILDTPAQHYSSLFHHHMNAILPCGDAMVYAVLMHECFCDCCVTCYWPIGAAAVVRVLLLLWLRCWYFFCGIQILVSFGKLFSNLVWLDNTIMMCWWDDKFSGNVCLWWSWLPHNIFIVILWLLLALSLYHDVGEIFHDCVIWHNITFTLMWLCYVPLWD